MPDPDNSLMQRLAERGKLARGGGGSDDGGDMLDARVAALESDVREVKNLLARIDARLDKFDERMRKLEIDVAEVRGRLANMPSTWTLVTTCFGMVAGMTTIVFALLRFATP